VSKIWPGKIANDDALFSLCAKVLQLAPHDSPFYILSGLRNNPSFTLISSAAAAKTEWMCLRFSNALPALNDSSTSEKKR
jgi:hypothetical protein